MKKILLYISIVSGLVLLPWPALAQPFDITTFDVAATGPWSSLAGTTLMVPKVANGSITLDGAASAAEYGGFQGVTVTPGNPDGTAGNAWILNFPDDRIWGGPDDSSFTYWLAHDDDNLYIGVEAKDDVVTSDDPNAVFWQDDAIEIVVDALNDRLDNNTDSSKDPFGGHNYVNFQGRFSAWDEAANAVASTSVWATGVDWTYGATGDVFGSGAAGAGGWKMEVRFKKRMFEDPAAGNKLRNGYVMGFNIGMDDDDKKGQGLNGDKSRTQDLEIQYFWANRQRYQGVNAEYLAALSDADRARQIWRTPDDPHELIIDPTGRLAHGGTGQIIFGYDVKSAGKILYLCANADLSGTDDAAMVALLRAKGYTVTPFTSSGPDGGEAMRAAAVGQDLILISESLGSGTTLEPNTDDPPVQKFIYRDTDIPVISFEAFMWDNADWTEHPADFSNEFSFFGNTGRTEDTQAEDLKLPLDSLYIKQPAHPIAGGLTGKVKVYDPPYSANYAKPSADADVIASVRENGEFPCIFVYEKGDKLVDGTVCPNKRIGVFTGQVAALTANWNPEIRWLTDAGKTLFLNTVAYAIGAAPPAAAGPVELGQTVNGFQDDFTGATRDPNWVPHGPAGDIYKQAGGLLSITVPTGDPNHLLYEAPGYSTTVQEVLARMRVTAFGPMGDYPRGGLGVGVGANSQGINLNFRDSTQGSFGRHFRLLDDLREWGPGTDIDWKNGDWFWVRLRQEPNATGGTSDLFAKIWPADGVTPEPAQPQVTWDYTPGRTVRAGFAGITGSSAQTGVGVDTLEVDYILIKADGLPQINVAFSNLPPEDIIGGPATISIARSANDAVITFTGTLEAADAVNGPWTAVAGATSPRTVPLSSATAKFYRSRQ